MAQNTINNNRDSIDDVPVQNIDVNTTLAQNLRASSIENSVSQQTPPNTPPRQNVGQSYISPLSKFVENLTPVTKKQVYELIKSSQDESSLTKRRRLEFLSSAPIDVWCNGKSVVPHDIETEPKTEDTSRDVHETTPVRKIDLNVTPAEDPRASFIENIVSQEIRPQILSTPPRQTVGDHSKSPLSKIIEKLTPVTKKVLYDLIKSSQHNGSTLTKRRLENITNSPNDMSYSSKPILHHGDDIETKNE